MQNMSRLIDADALKENLSKSYDSLRKLYDGLIYNSEKAVCSGQLATFLEAIMLIMEAPTIDAVPVVRCKDCKYRSYDYDCVGNHLCEKRGNRYYCEDNDFCSYGERRDSDGFVEVNNYEQKCPCGLRDYMEEEDCSKTKCNDCCPLTKGEWDG